MPVTYTSKRSYWETRAKLKGDELELLEWLEKNDREDGWTINEISKAMFGWDRSRVSARLNFLACPKSQDDALLVIRKELKRYDKYTCRLAESHRATCCEAQLRLF